MSTQVISRPSSAAVGSDFLFVDNIRFVTMWALFFEHTMRVPDGNVSVLSLSLTKFGTIGFFLASGFLLGATIDRQSTAVYLQKRFSRVFLPWLCWISLFTAVLVYLNVHHGRTPIVFGVNACHVILIGARVAADSPYWFVPKLLFSLCCLLLVRKLVGDRVSGIVWALASLFYAANVYLRWLPTSHRSAWLGFVFYLWLGVFCARHFSAFKQAVSRTRWSAILAVLAALWLCSFAESRLIGYLHPQDDPGNSIRLTNQLYSLCAVFLIAKAGVRLFPKFAKVREDTFGLYLTQPLVLLCANVALNKFVPLSFYQRHWNLVDYLLFAVVWPIVVYFAALAAVRAIAAIPFLRGTLGLVPERKGPQPVTAFPDSRSTHGLAGGRAAGVRMPAA